MIAENVIPLFLGCVFGFTLYWIAWNRGYNVGKSSAIEMMLDLTRRLRINKEIERIKKEKDEVSKL